LGSFTTHCGFPGPDLSEDYQAIRSTFGCWTPTEWTKCVFFSGQAKDRTFIQNQKKKGGFASALPDFN
jgi:hypothetical protein